METLEDIRLEGQDASGEWHRIASGRCGCGCPYLYAVDDRGIRWLVGDWESDAQAGQRCIDRECACHRRIRMPTNPLVALR
jgi:hypothetical protein